MKLVKYIKILISITILISAAYNSLADSYYSDYTNDPATILKSQLKFKLFGVATSSTKSTIQASPIDGKTAVDDNLIQWGWGGDIANVIFFTNHIAAEINLGLYVYKIKKSVLDNIFTNYATESGTEPSDENIYSIPLDLIAQYHFAPYGGFSPYAGIGYSAVYFKSKSDSFDVVSTHAPVIQIGINFIAQDNTLFSLEIKKYFLSTTISYKSSFLGLDEDVKSETKINPLVISLGISFAI